MEREYSIEVGDFALSGHQVKNLARIIIAGTSSGCGKTTVTCALLSAFLQKNIETSSFKCGPDYIDPLFHGKILGLNSSNLDPFFYDDETLKALLCENAKGISVIEGVMGFYDGMSIDSTDGSTYTVAKITKTPVILTINCKGTAYSILPVIEGFLKHKNDYNLAGVILNNISKTTYKKMKIVIENYFENKIKIFGYIPRLPDILKLESRHLGLVTADEIENIKFKLNKLGKYAAKTLDLDMIIETAKSAENLEFSPLEIKSICENVNIAVARDKAFCFYYRDNLRLLEKLGAKLIYFSPLEDELLPENADGLYIGGGYPELYVNVLANNLAVKSSIYKFLKSNKPCIAECGGFMYLTNSIDDYPMTGFIEAESYNTHTLSRFGYQNLTSNKDNLLCKKGESFKGHEFHYYDTNNNGADITAVKPSGLTWQACHMSENLYAGFPHLSFYSNINIAKNFIKKCKECQI